jgi:hypothetical protein
MSILTAASANTNALSVLAQASMSTAQLGTTREIGAIDNQIQQRLNSQIAALAPPSDSAVVGYLTAQINGLQTQQSTIAALSPQYGANATTLSELQNQLGTLQTAAANGDSAGFDAALSQANTDVSNLTATNAPAPFQPDGVAALLVSGLGIGPSSQYNLSTPSGQAAASAAVTAAQNLVGQVFAVTTANQLLTGDLTNELNNTLAQLTQQQQDEQQGAQASTQAQIQTLTQQAQEQEHLIELALGNTSELASSIFSATNPPTPATSPLGVLENQVGATAQSSTAAAQASPAILSLLA